MAVTVAHVITKLEFGGAQQNTLFTVSHLDSTRFRRILITGEPGILDAEANSIPGIQWYRVPWLVRPIRPWSDVRALVALTRLLRRLQPTIIHTHSSKAGIIGRLAAKLTGVPIIIHSVHGFGFTRYQPWLVRLILVALERAAARWTTRFFVVSENVRQLGTQLGLFSAERSTVIRSGIDVRAIRETKVEAAQKKRELGFAPEQPIVGMVAPLKPQKAPLDFVRMAALVQRACPGTGFLLVGDGAMRQLVENEVRRLGLSGCLRLAGWRRDVAEVMRCFDVFVLTSRWEGLPRVCLEARLSGLPLVCTRVDGTPEVVEHGVNGFLVEPADIQRMAEYVVQLLNDPQQARAMGRNGSALPGQFDIWEMVRRQEKEYEALLAQRIDENVLSEPTACGTPTKN